MAGKKKSGRRLSADDLAIWQNTVATTAPLHLPKRQRIMQDSVKQTSVLPADSAIQPFRLGERLTSTPKAPWRLPGALLPPATSPNVDKKNFDRLKKGRLRVDARLDLHGMTLTEAHPALIGFVQRSEATGKRLLLVITGKGGVARETAIMPERRGVLKQQVPQWLNAQPLAPLVLEVTQAHGKHGGSGAYYVYLKRRR
jgi:DNA-nicking Smr family endonuclease